MANLNDRIKKIGQYFKEMQVTNVDGQQIIYVVVQFPPKWFIDEGIPNKFGVSVAEGQEYEGQFFFCAEINVGFDKVFDAVEYNISKMKTAQERAKLLKEKVEELQNLFYDESISVEALKTLDFTYKGKKKAKAIMVPDAKETQEENTEGDKTDE